MARVQVNVYDYCKRMRESRINMVRTLAQYRFIYDVLYEGLLTNLHIIGENLKVNYRLLSNINPVTDKSYFREQFEVELPIACTCITDCISNS